MPRSKHAPRNSWAFVDRNRVKRGEQWIHLKIPRQRGDPSGDTFERGHDLLHSECALDRLGRAMRIDQGADNANPFAAYPERRVRLAVSSGVALRESTLMDRTYLSRTT